MQRAFRIPLAACWLALPGSLSGCMTVATQLSYATGVSPDGMVDPAAVVYGGVRVHLGMLGRGDGPWNGAMWHEQPLTQSLMTLFALIDLPLCLVVDTALLPVTVIEHFAGGPGAVAGQPRPSRE